MAPRRERLSAARLSTRVSRSPVCRSSRCTARTHSKAGTPASGWGSRAGTRSPAGSTRRCIRRARGRCGSTPGSAPAAESNARYQQLIANGTMGLSVAFDLPTQMGHDSDAPLAHGEVGKVGVAIDSVEDMRVLLGGIPLGQGLHLDDHQRPAALAAPDVPIGRRGAGRPGVEADRDGPERRAQGVHRARHVIFPPSVAAADRGHLRVLQGGDPEVEHHLISGYTWPRPAPRPRRRIAFTLADGIEYVRTAWPRDGRGQLRAPPVVLLRLAHDDPGGGRQVPAARRIWARVMREEFGAKDPKSQMLRFHTQTAGCS